MNIGSSCAKISDAGRSRCRASRHLCIRHLQHCRPCAQRYDIRQTFRSAPTVFWHTMGQRSFGVKKNAYTLHKKGAFGAQKFTALAKKSAVLAEISTSTADLSTMGMCFQGMSCNVIQLLPTSTCIPFYYSPPCQMSHAARAWRCSISSPFFTTAPCALPCARKRVSSGLYTRS